MENEAKKWVAKFQDQPDGENYNWVYDEDYNERKVPVRRMTYTINYDRTRYEFSDGSAIVICEDAWDFGIHRSHLLDGTVVEVCGEYGAEPEFAWCAGVMLDEKFQNA